MGQLKAAADVFRRVLPRTAQRDSTTGSGCRVENPAETGGCRSWECMSSSLRGDTACPVSSIRVFCQPGHFLSSAEFASRPSGEVLSSARFCRPWSPGCTADSHCRSAAGFSRRSISARHAAPRAPRLSLLSWGESSFVAASSPRSPRLYSGEGGHHVPMVAGEGPGVDC